MKLVFKEAIAFTLAMGIGFGSAVGIKGFNAAKQQKQGRQSQDNVEFVEEEYQMTSQEKLLASVTSLDVFAVNGVFEMKSKESQLFRANIDVAGDIKDFSNVKVNGNIDMNLNGVQIPAGLKYFDNTVYFNYRENYFKLATEHIMDFVSMLPDYGIGLSMPEELQNLDLNTITAMIDGLEEHASTNGDVYFTLGLSEDITLYVKSDAEYNFKGIRTDHINLNGMDLYLNLDLNKVDSSSVDLRNPKECEGYSKYQDFKPCFDMFDALYNSFKGKQNTLKLSVDLENEVEIDQGENYVGDPVYEWKSLFDADIFFSYDIEDKVFGLAGDVHEGERTHHFDGLYEDHNVYFGFNDLKIAISDQPIQYFIAYAMNVSETNYMEEILNKTTEFLGSDEMMDMIANADKVLGAIRVSENSFAVELDTDAIGLDMGTLVPTIRFSNGKLDAIELKDVLIKGMKLNISLTTEDYSPVVVNKDEFIQFDRTLTIVDAVLPLIGQTEFRLEFDGKVKDSKGVKKDINLDGGLQFDLDDKFGYGQANIIDRNDYRHNLKVDMESADEMYFSYNDSLNGKFNSQTLLDMFALFKDIAIDNPDEHWYELFDGFFKKFASTPVGKVLQGDYGALLAAHIIDDLVVTETSTKFVISLGIIGYENNSVEMEILYHYDDENYKSYLDGLNVTVNDFMGMDVEFHAYLKDFDGKFAATDKLDHYEEFLDFSDIKVLLELGIHTSKFDYFHFSATLDLDIPVISDFKEIKPQLDIQIRNNKGNVQVAVEIYKLPVIGIVNGNDGGHTLALNRDRDAAIYYENGEFFLKRIDNVYYTYLFGSVDYQVTYSAVYTTDYFLENIIDILLGKMFGLKSTYMNMVNNSTTQKDDSAVINYEKILKDFKHQGNDFIFKIDLNALTHVSMLDTVDLTVYSNNNELTGLHVYLGINLLSTIDIDLTLTTISKEKLTSSNQLTVMNEWVAARSNDARNADLKKVSDIKL